MARKLEVSAALKRGFDMVVLGWRRTGLVLALLAVASTVFNGSQGAAGSALLMLVGFGAYITLSFMATGALFRLSAIRSQMRDSTDLGPGGLQWKATEWALLKLTCLILFLALLAGLLVVVVLGLAIAGSGVDMAAFEQLADPVGVETAMADPAMRRFIAGAVIVGLAFYGLVIWLAVRLTLASAATAATGKVELGKAWSMTKGNFWRLLGGVIVIALPVIVISMIMGGATGGGQLSAEQTWAFSAAISLISAFLVVPMQIGFTADAYRQFTELKDEA